MSTDTETHREGEIRSEEKFTTEKLSAWDAALTNPRLLVRRDGEESTVLGELRGEDCWEGSTHTVGDLETIHRRDGQELFSQVRHSERE